MGGLTGTALRLTVDAVQTSTLDLTTARAPLHYDRRFGLGNGVGAGRADLMWSDTRTIAASGSESLDLAGSLVDALGVTLNFARVKALIVVAAAANGNDVVVGGASENAWIGPFGSATDKVKVRPGGALALFAPGATGYPVTAGTGDLLQLANSGAGTSVTYDVIIIGASA